MKAQVLCPALILLSSLIFSTFLPVCAAQTQDYSKVNLPDGAIARLGKGGVSYKDRGIAFSPEGSHLAVATSMGVWLYDAETFDELALLTGHKEEVTVVAFSPDGTKLATGSVETKNAEHTIKLWEVATGQNLITLRGHTDVVTTVAYSQDGTLLASGSKDKTVRLWAVSTGENIATLQGHEKMVFSIAFSPDGTKLASGSEDTSIRLREIPTGKAIYILGGVNSPQVGVTVLPARRPGQDINELQADNAVDPEPEIIRGLVFSVAFSPDGTKLASASWDNVKLWDVETGRYFATLVNELESSSFSVAFSPDGTKLASGSVDGTVLSWDVAKSIKLYPSKQPKR